MLQSEFLGNNSLNNIKNLIKDLNVKKVLVFCGKKSFVKSGASELFKEFLEKTKNKFFYKSFDYADYQDLTLSTKIINEFQPDIILAVGGGAVLDLAKLSNSLCTMEIDKNKLKESNFKIKKKFCKLVAIPTTAGSGAEATRHAVLYIDKNKYSIESSFILPDFIVIDPQLIITAPKDVSASSGIDALSQAIESLMSKRSNEESVQHSIKSLQYSFQFLEKHLTELSTETTHKMSLAALYSGKAINISKTTAPHAVSYPFTSHFGVKHGQAVSFTLCDFMKFNYENLKYSKASFDLKLRFDKIFKIFHVNSLPNFCNKVGAIINKIGLSNDIKDFNVKNSNDINLILQNINSQRLANNPVEIDINLVKSILLKKI
tara:strand:- start:404 stop:1528 length:1125 start_codon:yes stop_codon:yes gene_type:complete